MMIEINTIYLFVTDRDRQPESMQTGEDLVWSCSKDTERGDMAFVYVKGEGIVYQWLVTSEKAKKASPNERWKYECQASCAHELMKCRITASIVLIKKS